MSIAYESKDIMIKSLMLILKNKQTLLLAFSSLLVISRSDTSYKEILSEFILKTILTVKSTTVLYWQCYQNYVSGLALKTSVFGEN